MTQMTIQQAIDLAVRHHQSGRLGDAEAIYRQILVADPNQPDALHLLGVVACQAGRFDIAIELIGRAVAIQPQSVDFHCSLGNALQSLARYEEAIAEYRNVLALNPAHVESHNNLGCALRDSGKLDEAIAAFRKALELRPDYLEAMNNLGGALRDSGQLDQAVDHLQKSLSVHPHSADIQNSLGAALEQQGQYSSAIDAYRHAIALSPNHVEAHVNLGITLMRNGDYPAGLKEYEWRLQRRDTLAISSSFAAKPRWNGELLDGQTILLHAEQGFGDTIQFVRYIPHIIERGGKVIVRCQPELHRLLQNIFPAQSINEPLPAFDIHCQLASLPFVFGTTLETIPNATPYLRADDFLTKKWSQRLFDEKKLKVGLVWAGRSQHRDDRNRSMPLGEMAELLRQPHARFISLQKGEATQQLIELPSDIHVSDWTAELHDFADTAALIDQLDLVITVDTAVGHLAAAMGKPVWMLLPFVPDWRWMLGRDDSPWYPTIQLFRQPKIGDWQTPIQQIVQKLKTAKEN